MDTTVRHTGTFAGALMHRVDSVLTTLCFCVLVGCAGSPLGTASLNVRCYTSPEQIVRLPRIGGYSSSYSPVSVVSEALWYDYFLSFEEFSEIAANHVSSALLFGQHSIYLTPPPKSCPASGPFSLSLTLPHYNGGPLVNVTLTSDPPGLVSRSWIAWNTSATGSLTGPQSFTVTCGNGTQYTRVYLALTADSDNVHYVIDSLTSQFSVAADLPEPMFNLNISGARPYFASPVDPTSLSIALNGVNQFIDLNNASDTGLPGNPAFQGRILPDFFQSPNPNALIFPVQAHAHSKQCARTRCSHR